MEDRKAKIYDFIKSNLLNAVVILISGVYVVYGMVKIQKTDLTLEEVIANAGMGLIVAFIIKTTLGESGFNKGYGSNIWHTNLEKYSNACNLANPYIDRVDLFYESEEKEQKKKYRQNNLMAIRLKYSDFFDNEGNYTNPTIKPLKMAKKGKIKGVMYLTNYQRKILNKCIKVKIHNLNLFSEYGVEVENLTRPEKTDKHQRAKMLGRNFIALITTATIGAYFLPKWNNWDWGTFISSLIQVIMWVGIGITQLYQNYNYVVIEKTNKLTRKMELIIKFVKGCEAGLYTIKEESENEPKELLDKNGVVSIDSVSDTANLYID